MDQEFSVDENRMAFIVIGMAGTGKTTFVNQLQKYLNSIEDGNNFLVNLDPAVFSVPYTPDVDIRNEVNYKELMKKHELGPNGAIMAALNLYCLQLNTLLETIENLPKQKKYIIVDTPGQIEAFTWSSSGTIISQTFSTSMPTTLIYVVDIARCQNPNSLMSNLLFCCSIFYKMKLPLVLIFNKCDAADASKPLEWMRDYQKFQEALSGNGTYLSTLSKQMALTMDTFYENFNTIQVSSLSGVGFDQLSEAFQKSKEEYLTVTLPDLKKKVNSKKNTEFEQAKKELERVRLLQNKQK